MMSMTLKQPNLTVAAAFLLWVMPAVAAFVPSLDSTQSSLSVPKRRGDITQLFYDPNPDDLFDRIDVSTIQKQQNKLLEWLENLSVVERSEPDWIGEDILDISHALLIQEHLESLVMTNSNMLFPTEWSKAKFDFDWRCIFLKSMPELSEILDNGRCNSHPLRLQLVAIPPHTALPLHVHATGELDIPILGELWERQSNVLLPPDMLCRQPEHSIGTPLSNFSEKPTREELDIIRQDLSNRVVLHDYGSQGIFHTQRIVAGDCLVNQIGSIHQSFTKDKPCLLWVLGANVHAHFQPGNFHQRDGIHELTGIEHLLQQDRN